MTWRAISAGPYQQVLVEWGREGDVFDVGTHVVRRTVGFNIVTQDGQPASGFPEPIEAGGLLRTSTRQLNVQISASSHLSV
jgi:hypothetical protein